MTTCSKAIHDGSAGKAIERKLVILLSFLLCKENHAGGQGGKGSAFYHYQEAGELLGKRDEHADENVAVQGIIDCYSKDGEIVVVDLKAITFHRKT